jgi:hypothetical protein
MKVLKNTCKDKKDLIKAGNSVTMFKDVVGKELTITGIVIYEKEEVDEKTGEVSKKTVSCVKDNKGEFVSTISPRVANILQMITESYTEDEIGAGLPILVKTKKTNSGRDFIYIDLK